MEEGDIDQVVGGWNFRVIGEFVKVTFGVFKCVRQGV